MTIKLIATDLDGTFLRNDRTFDVARFNRLLDQMEDQDVKMVVATGNKVEQTLHYFKETPTNRLTYISSNGAMVSDTTGILYKRPVSKEQIKKVLDWNTQTRAKMENLIVLSGIKAAYVSNHATPEMIQAVEQFYPKVIQVEKFLEIEDDILVMELLWPENADIKYFVQVLRKKFGEELHTTGSGFGSVSILAANTNKETGLEALSRIWGIKPEEMVAFGDNSNDLEMLRYVGHPFVMPNAAEFMKERISQQAKADNENDGVLETIEMLLADQAQD